MDVALLIPGGGTDLRAIRQAARAAEEGGLAGVYLGETGRSAFIPLAAVAMATDRVAIGPYALNAYARTPYMAAVASLDLDELSEGRVVVGIAAGNGHVNAAFQDARMDHPLQKLRDYHGVMAAMVGASADQVVDYDGRTHSLRGWVAQQAPHRRTIPIHLAAMGPHMLQLAGEVADGVALGAMISVRHLQEAVLPEVARGAETAGRSVDDVRRRMAAFVVCPEDPGQATREAKSLVCRMFHPKPHAHYERLVAAQGYGQVPGEVTQHLRRGATEAALAAVPDQMLADVVIAGSPDECAEQIARYDGLVDEVLLIDANSFCYRRAEDAPPAPTFDWALRAGAAAVA